MPEPTTEQLLAEELKGSESTPETTSTPPGDQDQKPTGDKPVEEREEANPPTEKKYKVLDREVNPDELYDEFGKSQSYIAKLEAEIAASKKNKTVDPKPEDNPDQKGKDSEVDSADAKVIAELDRLGFVKKDAVEKILDEKFTAREKDIITKAVKTTAARTEVMEGLAELRTDFDGSMDTELNVPKPKVDTAKVLDYIQKNPGTDLSLLDIAKITHHDDFVKYEARKLSVQPNPVPKTEDGGLKGGTPPAPKKFNFGDQSVEAGLREMLGVQK